MDDTQSKVTSSTTPPTLTAGAGTLLIVALAVTNLSEGIFLGEAPAATGALGELFHQTPSALTWISTVQLLAAGVMTPVFSRLGDLYGHRRILRVAVIFALIGTILCATGASWTLFLVGRAFEGSVAAFTALGIGIARDRLPQERVKTAVGWISAGLVFGGACGLVVAGQIFTFTHDVRAVLWAPAALFLISLIMIFTLVPESTRRAKARIDWIGALLLSAGLALLLYGLGKGAPKLAMYAGIVLLVAWVVSALMVREPLVDLREAGRRTVGPIYLASIILGVSFFGAQTAMSTFLAAPAHKVGYGYTLNLSQIAWVLFPTTLLAALGAILMAPIAKALGHKATMYLGCAVMGGGYLLMAAWHAQLWAFIVTSGVTYLGLGIVQSALPAVFAERASLTSTGIMTGLYNTAKSVGGSVANAAFAVVLAEFVISGTKTPTEFAYVLVWIICGAASLVAIIFVAFAANRGRAASATTEPAPAAA